MVGETRTIRVRGECIIEWYRCAGILKLPKSSQQGIYSLVDDGLQLPHCTLGEEGIDSSTANAMQVVIIGAKHGVWKSKLVGIPIPSMPTLPRARIQLLDKIGTGYVQFVRIDADNRAVFLVHATDLEGILPSQEYIVIEFVPIGPRVSATRRGDISSSLPEANCRQLWSRESGNRAKPQPMHSLSNNIH
jgi:hypothetical protein